MNLHRLQGQELIYFLHKKIEKCFLAYEKHLRQVQYEDQFTMQYNIEREILIWMIREILKSGEYTLDGIAYHARLPFDVVVDAAMGMQKELSMILWIKVADLFLQLRGEH